LNQAVFEAGLTVLFVYLVLSSFIIYNKCVISSVSWTIWFSVKNKKTWKTFWI